MDECEEFQQYYNEILSEEELPEAVTARYQILRCVRRGEGKELYLAANRLTYQRCIIKLAYGRQREFLRREAGCLIELWKILEEEERTDKEEQKPQSPGIVHFYEFMEDDDYAALVREYCEGVTLEQLVNRRGRLTETEIIEYGVQICGILAFLHRTSPPMIHRDVKPENFLVTADGRLIMLDFDTVRHYGPEKERDTVFVGSKDTAAPEQFGFSQTDVRTDIYGAGRTLLYLACGSFGEKRLEKATCSGNLKKVIRKAIAFEPDRRQQTAEQMLQELKRCGSISKIRPEKRISAISVFSFVLGSVLTVFLWNAVGGREKLSKSPVETVADYREIAWSEEQETAKEEAEAVRSESDGEILFHSEQYAELFDSIVAAYTEKDYDGLEKANQTLIDKLYKDPVLLERRQEDYELFEQEDFSPAITAELSEAGKINYELWRRNQVLGSTPDEPPVSGREIAAKLEDQLTRYSTDPSNRNNLNCLCMYILSDDSERFSMGAVLADYLDLVHFAMDTWMYEPYFQGGK